MKNDDPYAKETGEPSQLLGAPKDIIICIGLFVGLLGISWLFMMFLGIIRDLTGS